MRFYIEITTPDLLDRAKNLKDKISLCKRHGMPGQHELKIQLKSVRKELRKLKKMDAVFEDMGNPKHLSIGYSE